MYSIAAVIALPCWLHFAAKASTNWPTGRTGGKVWNFLALGGAMTDSANFSGSASHLMRLQAMLEPEFSVLRDYAMRPLPVALAHRLVNARPGDPYLETFHRLYEALTVPDRTRCQAEIAERSRLVMAIA
jgi:hypothetical protein